jgi:hypothetical protein
VHFCGYGFLLICSNLGQKLKLEIRNSSILVFQRVSFSGCLLSAFPVFALPLAPCASPLALSAGHDARSGLDSTHDNNLAD